MFSNSRLRSHCLFGLAFCISGCAADRLPESSIAFSGQKTGGGAFEQTIRTLAPRPNEAITYTLCEADPQTGLCLDPKVGLQAFGLGGLFLPLVMRVDGFELRGGPAAETLMAPIDVEFSTSVNGIPPFCEGAAATFVATEEKSIRLSVDPLYCNWVVVGNVVTQFEFGIDRIDTTSRSFSGSYALQINGTGNAVGGGYFRADATGNAS